ncbi:MAG: hypothetical protein M1823_002369 [Watsoniomyces obsoletus]|nr:MAG: hypothetical protein M1823_002369 [Watsoniomyces obsoletus]
MLRLAQIHFYIITYAKAARVTLPRTMVCDIDWKGLQKRNPGVITTSAEALEQASTFKVINEDHIFMS